MSEPFSERERQLLLHIDTLTTAIEDALAVLDVRLVISHDDRFYLRTMLQSSMDSVWEDGETADALTMPEQERDA